MQTNSNLTDQLEEAKRKSKEGPIELQRMVDGLEVRCQQLERELIMEVERKKNVCMCVCMSMYNTYNCLCIED